MTIVTRRPAIFTAGLASVAVAVAVALPRLLPMDLHGLPGDAAISPYLLFGAAHLLVAVGMLLTLRTRRPLSWPGWSVWGFTVAVVVLSGPLFARWIAERLQALTGLTGQNGPMWFVWPVGCLVLLALLSQVVRRDADRPAMEVAGLTAFFTLWVWFWTLYFGRPSAGWIGLAVPSLAGSLLLVVAVCGWRAGWLDGLARDSAAPGPRLRMAIGRLLLAAGAAMTAAQLLRWHTCLGWRWSAAEDDCSTVRSASYDYAFPNLSAQIPGSSALHGLGLLMLAMALALALGPALRGGPGGSTWSTWSRLREVGVVVIWSVMVAVAAMGGVLTLAPSLLFADDARFLASNSRLVDPMVFAALAGLLAVGMRARNVAEPRHDWWALALIKLFAGLTLTNFLVEFFFWSSIFGGHGTPPFTGQLRAIVLLSAGLRLVSWCGCPSSCSASAVTDHAGVDRSATEGVVPVVEPPSTNGTSQIHIWPSLRSPCARRRAPRQPIGSRAGPGSIVEVRKTHRVQRPGHAVE